MILIDMLKYKREARPSLHVFHVDSTKSELLRIYYNGYVHLIIYSLMFY